MLVRFAGFTEQDLYRFYNLGHEDYPNLPPPPCPDKLQQFYFNCVEQIIIDKNRENSPEPQQTGPSGYRRQMTP